MRPSMQRGECLIYKATQVIKPMTDHREQETLGIYLQNAVQIAVKLECIYDAYCLNSTQLTLYNKLKENIKVKIN